MQLQDMQHSREQATQIEIAKIKAEAQIVAAQITAKQAADNATMAADAGAARELG